MKPYENRLKLVKNIKKQFEVVGVEDSPDPMKLGIGVGSRSGVPWVLAHFAIVLRLLISNIRYSGTAIVS